MKWCVCVCVCVRVCGAVGSNPFPARNTFAVQLGVVKVRCEAERLALKYGREREGEKEVPPEIGHVVSLVVVFDSQATEAL